MWVERNHTRRQSPRRCLRTETPKECLVALVDTVEHADRQRRRNPGGTRLQLRRSK